MRLLRQTLLAAALIIPVAAHADLIDYSFSITGSTGPMAGITETGTLAYDSSSIVLGGLNTGRGLLLDLNFTWNGITYDQTTANTGELGWDASGNLTSVLFGNHCGSDYCMVSGGSNDWYVRAPSSFGTFVYGDGSSTYSGTVTGFSLVTTDFVSNVTRLPPDLPVPEPASLPILGLGVAGLLAASKRRFLDSCRGFLHTRKIISLP